MATAQLLTQLRQVASANLGILTDEHDEEFRSLLQRWSNIGKKTPSAIICPDNELDIQETVKWASKASIPFVVKGGGHSEWSTIGKEGVIIDLSRYSGVKYDSTSQTATLKGSVLSKDVAVELAAHGRCTALGNGNAVGAIGYFLGGGASITTSATGYGAQQIISARLVTAQGELVDVNESTHPDLLWALRGAGQFFGLVTQLTIQTFPSSVLGNDKGVIWAGLFVYPLDRAREVAETMLPIMDNAKYATSGLIMITSPPPGRVPSIVISGRMTGDPKTAGDAFEPLYRLKPVFANGSEVPVQNASDARAALGAKGDFKRFSIVGLHGFDLSAFLQTVEIYRDMIKECPDSKDNSAFNFQWDSRLAPPSRFESAIGLEDIRFFQNNLLWHTDAANPSKLDVYADRCIEAVRSASVNLSDPVDYVNGTRTGPLAHRFRGAERLRRLQDLKKQWDPQGRFTTQLL